jgi:hypothetical protein
MKPPSKRVKRKVDEDEVEAIQPIKKKKAGSSEEQPAKKKKPRPSTPELKSRAKDIKKSIQEDIDDVDSKLEGFTDNTWIHTYEIMFRKLKKIMRTVEAKVINSESAQDIYALMALYNQMREVIADIRSMIDLSQNTQRIIDNILYPMVRDISNNYVDAIFMIKKTLRSNVESDKYIELKAEIDSCLKEHAKYIQSSYEKSSEQLAKLLEE